MKKYVCGQNLRTKKLNLRTTLNLRTNFFKVAQLFCGQFCNLNCGLEVRLIHLERKSEEIAHGNFLMSVFKTKSKAAFPIVF